MKRISFVLLCLVCAGSGLALGHFVWPPLEAAPAAVARRPVRSAPQEQVAVKSVAEVFAALRPGPDRAAYMIAAADRNDVRALSGLIEASAADEVALGYLCETWLRTNPAALIKALGASNAMQGKHRSHCMKALHSALEDWNETAPDEAWKSAAELPATLRGPALNNLAGLRLMKDPEGGMELLRANPGVTPTMYPEFKSEQARREALPIILSLPESNRKTMLLNQATKGLPLTEAMQMLNAHPDGITPMARTAALNTAARKSVQEVMAYHDTATGAERYAAARVVGDELVKKDAAAAVAWAQENLSGQTRARIIREAAKQLAKKDPAGAEAARALLPESFRPAAGK